MVNFATSARVRLTPEQRAAQPEIGDVIGTVAGDNSGIVEVHWPRFRAWHKAADLELVEPNGS